MKPSLRVAMFVGSFPVLTETFIARQIIGLLRAGHEVDIYADARPGHEGPMHPEVEAHGLMERVTFMEMPLETIPYELPVWPLHGQTWCPGALRPVPNWKRVAKALPAFLECLVAEPRLTLQAINPEQCGYRARSLSALGRLHRLLHCRGRPRQYDVLHAHFGPVGESFRWARELFHAPFVVTFHGYDYSTVPRREGGRVYEKLFAAADAVTANSSYTRSQLQQLGAPTELIHILPVGLDPDCIPFKPRSLAPGQTPRLLTVARLAPIKGQEFVIRALAELLREGRTVEYHLVGGGPQRGALEALAQSLGVNDSVHFHGPLAGKELLDCLDAAHLFVLTSVSVEGDQEGQGLVLQEAQAAGLPVVATRHGALPEGLVPDQSGFLVPERDVPALAQRLRKMLDQPDAWVSWGNTGRQYVATHYNMRKLTCDLMEIYRQAERGYRSARPPSMA